MKSAYTLTRQAVLHYANKNIIIDDKLFQMPVPPGAPQIVSTVEAIMDGYPASLNLPQVCDLALSEIYVKGNLNGGWLQRIFGQTHHTAGLDLLKRFLTYLTQAGACPQEILKEIEVSESASGARQMHSVGKAPYETNELRNHGDKQLVSTPGESKVHGETQSNELRGDNSANSTEDDFRLKAPSASRTTKY